MEAFSFSTCSYCGATTSGHPYCCQGCRVLAGAFASRKGLFPSMLYLDQPNFRELYRLKSGSFDYELYIEGLHCSSCVHLIEKLPLYDETIDMARVDYGRSRLYVQVREEFSLARLIDLLWSLGYGAHFLKASEQTDDLQKEENKNFLKKIAVAGACAGNIMLFVIPVYSGLEGSWKSIFNWMSFILFLPVLLYSGTAFYQGAWNSLRLRSINVDLPITVALWAGFLLSTINLVRGQGEIYFDSTASFIFLILCSRYFLKRSQQKFLSSFSFADVLRKDRFTRITAVGESFVSLGEIKEGDQLKLEHGQICPVDGVLGGEGAMIDTAVLNGEPMPRKFEAGMSIMAGAKVISHEVRVRVTHLPENSHLAKILRQLQEGLWKKSKFVNLTDRCAQGLILLVFGIAVIFFMIFYDQNPQEAFNRSLALIVLACPCALALGAPLAMALAVRKAQAYGILIKNSDILEKILSVKNIFFDKTGTLTEMDLFLKTSNPAELSDDLKVICLSLEQKSFHPIAFALRKAWPGLKPIGVDPLTEHLGYGVKGIISSNLYSLSTNTPDGNERLLQVVLKENDRQLCSLAFENAIRPEAMTSIQALREQGYETFVLSGDALPRVQQVAEVCGVPKDHVFFGLSAEEKRETLGRYSQTLMIGDGSNDALSLQAATVGIAVKGSSPLNLQAADICFTRGGLEPLIHLFTVAKQARRVLLRNLAFSLIYNFVGGALALLGYINPWVAALLMPLSSFLILLSTLWGLK